MACGERLLLRQWVVVADGGDQQMLPVEIILKGSLRSPRPHVNIRAFSPLLKYPPRHHLSFQGLDKFLISCLTQLDVQTPISITFSEKDL